RQGGVLDASVEDLYRVGTSARVVSVSTRGANGCVLELSGVRRVKLVDFVQRSPYLRARVAPLQDAGDGVALDKRAAQLKAAGARALRLDGEGQAQLREVRHPGQVADVLGQLADAPVEVKQALLEEVRLSARLKKAQRLLHAGRKAAGGSRPLPGRHLLSYGAASALLGVHLALTRPDWHQPLSGALYAALGVAALNLVVELWRYFR
ncbi:MAG TPA: LON peptidase substrate-binding domain-containing protein, partial [Myxococcaceae bacterium]|nr:LON peptidase substrate-binding domain-containing protein [Myxococcaceae bacterium]